MVHLNILVIDDEAQQFQSLLEENFKILAEQNNPDYYFDFVFKETEQEGKDFLDKNYFMDLVILDLVFKTSGGETKSFKLLKYIKEYYPKIPVLLLSSTRNIDDLKKAGFDKQYRSDNFISKDNSINKGQDEKILDPDFQIIYNAVVDLLFKFGKIPVKNGVLITHGTDTMAWALAILRYGLYNVRTNILITGSQLPLEGTFSPSDAIGNMLTSVKILNMLEPPNIIQVFNDGVHIFNKNLVKVKKWDFDAFTGNSFGKIDAEELKIIEEDVYILTKKNKLEKLYFIKTGGTIDSFHSEEGLIAEGDFTDKYLKALGEQYFNTFETKQINPKDSSLFNPLDWEEVLKTINNWNLAEYDSRFDWDILPILISPFLQEECYDILSEQVINKYSGVIILGYGAGNVNIFSSKKTTSTVEYGESFGREFGAAYYKKQKSYSLIPFLEKIEKYNKSNPENYKFIVMSSQVPLGIYDIDYQAGQIPLYYGTLPSGDLSYPEAQTKLAYILGHKKLISELANKNSLTYEQLVKSCFMSGIHFNKSSNRLRFLKISEKECKCKIIYIRNNVFVKNSFENAIEQIVEQYKKK